MKPKARSKSFSGVSPSIGTEALVLESILIVKESREDSDGSVAVTVLSEAEEDRSTAGLSDIQLAHPFFLKMLRMVLSIPTSWFSSGELPAGWSSSDRLCMLRFSKIFVKGL